MSNINLKFHDTAEALFAIKNLADAQFELTESIQINGYTSDKAFSIRTIAEIISQCSEQLATLEMERDIKKIVEE